MNIEDELRGALDVSAPPPTTTLDHVLKRGRRRVFAQRAGAMLGVVAVIAGIGIGATTLNQAAPDSTPADQPNYGPATVEHMTGWQRVDTPRQVPTGTWSSSAGGYKLIAPLCDIKAPTWQRRTDLGALSLDARSVSKWIDQARKLFPEVTISDANVNSAHTNFEFDVSDSRGTGSIRISAAHFGGTPLENADDALWKTGDCQPAQRLIRADGTVMQLHSVRPSEPFQTLTQVLAVYNEGGLLVELEMRNFGSPDYTADPANPSVTRRTGAGRPTPPLTEEQFAKLGPAIAGVA